MKKLLIVIAFAFQAGLTHAQFVANDLLLGGSVGFHSSKTESKPDDFVTSGYTFNPQFLYMVNAGFGIGLNIGITGTKEKPSDDKTTELHFGPAFRLQGKPIEKASFYGQLNLNIGSGTDQQKATYVGANGTINTYTRKDKYSSIGILVYPGVNYMISKHFYLDMSYGMLNYISRDNKPDDTHDTTAKSFKTSGFEISFGLESLRLGAIYKF
ncbi:MAG: outer membrane beta-barrel protein [Bacteroidota bacterium]